VYLTLSPCAMERTDGAYARVVCVLRYCVYVLKKARNKKRIIQSERVCEEFFLTVAMSKTVGVVEKSSILCKYVIKTR